ncbi:hypothetical protein [Phaeocystidibacter luteus]|uniref:Uncharacterized protein n=1 Tax=Phaeocystidibacter luteus TaxID=911197 RepID=A0A6N6REX5_9FLAO|nr:hypothetical protein [Phaeocystidibacter luteus]KAB2805425.1 hypothetical protein F8C67_13300 [Phaeocystidibacter luteus]
MNKFRNSPVMRMVYGLMGLYMLNLSVDSSDLYPNHIPEDLSINDQESIVEFFVETVLGFDEAIDEHDESDFDHSEIVKVFKLDYFPTDSRNQLVVTTDNQSKGASMYQFHSSHWVVGTETPPPQMPLVF